nr:RlmE family RNA methyltransferase [Sphingomonas telluris]
MARGEAGRGRPRDPRRDIALADGEGRPHPVKRIRTAKGRKVSSTRWLERQLNDPYVRRAKAENYRSRAAYKLLELDEKFGLLKGVKAVVDLGITPGGWSQVVRRRTPQASVVGIDLLPTDPIDGVTIFQMDFMDESAPDRLKEALGGQADLVLSDMAANTVGHQQTDHLRTMALVEAGLLFATEVLRPGGAYVAKVLAGGADNQLVAEMKRHFTTVKHAKPPASRKDSSEWYVIAQGFKSEYPIIDKELHDYR